MLPADWFTHRIEHLFLSADWTAHKICELREPVPQPSPPRFVTTTYFPYLSSPIPTTPQILRTHHHHLSPPPQRRGGRYAAARPAPPLGQISLLPYSPQRPGAAATEDQVSRAKKKAKGTRQTECCRRNSAWTSVGQSTSAVYLIYYSAFPLR